jgi:hypothetical protein
MKPLPSISYTLKATAKNSNQKVHMEEVRDGGEKKGWRGGGGEEGQSSFSSRVPF